MNIERIGRRLPELQLGVSALMLLGALINLNVSADSRNKAEAYAQNGQVELFQQFNNKANTDLNTGLILLLSAGSMGIAGFSFAMHRSQEDMNRYLAANRHPSSSLR